MPSSAGFTDLESAEVAEAGSARWPRVVGTIGIIAAVVMFIDKLDDLLMLPLLRSREWWAGMFGEDLAADIVRWMPPSAWIAFASLTGMTLGALLFVGAWRLRRRRRSGVELCRTWAWLALAWLLVEVGGSLWWISGHIGELQELAPGDWQGPAVFTILVVLAVLGALPIFLLSWFSRPDIKAQLAGWPQ